MSYSATEKKRIRKSFAKRPPVLDVPYLLTTQLDSYTDFLQLGVPVEKRAEQGLQAAFQSVFPIVSHNGYARLEFVQYALGEPAFDVKECQQRGLTFCSPLRAPACARVPRTSHRSLRAATLHLLCQDRRPQRGRREGREVPGARRLVRQRPPVDVRVHGAALPSLVPHDALARVRDAVHLRIEDRPEHPAPGLAEVLVEAGEALAVDLAPRFEPLLVDSVDAEAIDGIIDGLTTVNRRLDVYLLGPDGMIKEWFMDADKRPLIDFVDVAPLVAFERGTPSPVLGEDPARPGEYRPFSVAPITIMGEEGCFHGSGGSVPLPLDPSPAGRLPVRTFVVSSVDHSRATGRPAKRRSPVRTPRATASCPLQTFASPPVLRPSRTGARGGAIIGALSVDSRAMHHQHQRPAADSQHRPRQRAQRLALHPVLAKVHASRQTPWVSVAVTMMATAAVVAFSGGSIAAVANVAGFVIFIVYALVNAALIWLRYARPSLERPFRSPIRIGWFPVLAALGLASSLAMLTQFDAVSMLAGAATIGAGLAGYALTSRFKK